MSAAVDTDPEPNRPDLHLVRSEDRAGSEVTQEEQNAATDSGGPDEEAVQVPPEVQAEVTGPVPMLDAEGHPVAARAPLDVRAKDAAVRWARSQSRMSTRPPSMAETLAYSQEGDWAAADNAAKRGIHGLATLATFTLTWPLDVILRSRDKPIAFVLTLAVLITLTQLL